MSALKRAMPAATPAGARQQAPIVVAPSLVGFTPDATAASAAQ
jgi:hypothetical protein